MMPAYYPERWGPLITLCEDLQKITDDAKEYRREDGRVQIIMDFPTVYRHPHRLIIRWLYNPTLSNPQVIRGIFIRIYDKCQTQKDNLELCGVHLKAITHNWLNGPVVGIEVDLLVPEVFDEIKGLRMGEWWSLERLCKALSTTPPSDFGISR